MAFDRPSSPRPTLSSRQLPELARQLLSLTHRSYIEEKSTERLQLDACAEIAEVLHEVLTQQLFDVDIGVLNTIYETFNLFVYFAFDLKVEKNELAELKTTQELKDWVRKLAIKHERLFYRNGKFGCKDNDIFGSTYLDYLEKNASPAVIQHHLQTTLQEGINALYAQWIIAQTTADPKLYIINFMVDRFDHDKNFSNTLSTITNWADTVAGKIDAWLKNTSDNAKLFIRLHKEPFRALDTIFATFGHKLLDKLTAKKIDRLQMEIDLLEEKLPETQNAIAEQAEKIHVVMRKYFLSNENDLSKGLAKYISKQAIHDYLRSDFTVNLYREMYPFSCVHPPKIPIPGPLTPRIVPAAQPIKVILDAPISAIVSTVRMDSPHP